MVVLEINGGIRESPKKVFCSGYKSKTRDELKKSKSLMKEVCPIIRKWP
jgi:hypothetical protein